jgi:hypothetical protein
MGALSGKVFSRANRALSVLRRWPSRADAIGVALLVALAAGPLAKTETKQLSDAAASAAAKDIVAREVAFQKSEIDFNYAALEKLMAPEYVELSQSFMNRDQIFATLRRVSGAGCRIQPVKMRDARVTFLTPEIATVVYRATQAGTCYGRTFSVDANISTLWIHRDGRWQAEMHSELLAGS